MTVEPGNVELMNRSVEIDKLRSLNKSTIPTILGNEKKTNPFLRPDSKDLH